MGILSNHRDVCFGLHTNYLGNQKHRTSLLTPDNLHLSDVVSPVCRNSSAAGGRGALGVWSALQGAWRTPWNWVWTAAPAAKPAARLHCRSEPDQ